jgi:hypothetical protein
LAATLGFAARRLRRERRVPAFGQTLHEGRGDLARIEAELSVDERREASAHADRTPFDELPALARAYVAGAFAV